MPEWCKHYQAMSDHDECKIGIVYRSIMTADSRVSGPPCFSKEGKPVCEQAIYPTQGELEAERREVAQIFKKFQADLDKNICPHCGTPIERREQVGRCAYARPCGCRLYQGKA